MDDGFIIDRETKKGFQDSVISVLRSAESRGWTLFQIYDLGERLAAKGFIHDRLKIIEICSARHSSRLLGKNRLASLCMPCRISVSEEGGKARIAAIKPTAMPRIFEGIEMQDAMDTEKEMLEIIEGAL